MYKCNMKLRLQPYLKMVFIILQMLEVHTIPLVTTLPLTPSPHLLVLVLALVPASVLEHKPASLWEDSSTPSCTALSFCLESPLSLRYYLFFRKIGTHYVRGLILCMFFSSLPKLWTLAFWTDFLKKPGTLTPQPFRWWWTPFLILPKSTNNWKRKRPLRKCLQQDQSI